jgi:cell division protein FtsI/penicillin-binding protein 2
MKRAQVFSTLALAAVGVTLLGLAGRVAWLEKHVSPEQVRKLQGQHTATLTVMPFRGPIYFADGTEAATSVRMYNLFADPSFIADPTGKSLEKRKLEKELAELPAGDPKIEMIRAKIKRCEELTAGASADAEWSKEVLAEALAPLLEMDPEDLTFELEENQTYADDVTPRRFMWLKKEVDENFHDRFMKLKAELKEQAKTAAKSKEADKARILSHALDGVGFVKSVRRVYPMQQLGAFVVGKANAYMGTDALEFAFDPMMVGKPGKMQVTKDATQHTLVVEDEMYKPADDGRAIWMTIDPVIQSIVEQELNDSCTKFKAESGCAVIMDPHTGKILAMASWPPFNPAEPNGSLEARRNKCITDPYEPGSIFKPFIVGYALDRGLLKVTDVFNGGNGNWYDPTGRLVKDTHGCGLCTVPEVLIKSSNVCMAQIGWKIGNPALYEAVTSFEFGKRTGIELPGDQRGLVKPFAEWNNGTKTSVPFGYEIAATPLQLVRAFGAFANDGKMLTPRVVGAVEDVPGHSKKWSEISPGTEKQVVSAKTAQTMREIMVGVFGPHGTAKSKEAQPQLYTLYGKTGTAKLAAHGEGHYTGDQYNSSFLVGGPVAKPQLVALMAIHRPDRSLGYFGGTVSAPGAVRMMERSLVYLRVPPDLAGPVAAGH